MSALIFAIALWASPAAAADPSLADRGPARAEAYRVGAGDTLKIEVYGEPSLTRDVRVSPTCAVDLQLIGPVLVCGATTPEIAERIRQGYADGYLREPSVFVDVAVYGSQRVEVKGAIKKPGIYVLEGVTSLSELITIAGGPDSPSVFRVTVSGSGETLTFDLSELDRRPERVVVAAGHVVNLHPPLTVSVFGEVRSGGQLPYIPGLTVTDALGLAGGPTDVAGLARSYVLRAEDGVRERVNIRRIQRGRAPDVKLRPDDQLVIRRSVL
jgi:polysaccharide biosynthesis/export protein